MSENEYKKLVSKIVEHMKQTGEWGEFISAKYSPFAYNETVAQEYFPLTEEQAKQHSYYWLPNDIAQYQPQTYVLAENIVNESDGVLKAILQCKQCNRNYKVVKQELESYKTEQLSIPRYCPNCRHLRRMQQRTPRALWQRCCMCTQTDHEHKGRCDVNFSTAYSADAKAIVYCEVCYQKTIY